MAVLAQCGSRMGIDEKIQANIASFLDTVYSKIIWLPVVITLILDRIIYFKIVLHDFPDLPATPGFAGRDYK